MTRLNAPRKAKDGQGVSGLEAGPEQGPRREALPDVLASESLIASLHIGDSPRLRPGRRMAWYAMVVCLVVTVAVLTVWGTQFACTTATPVALAAEIAPEKETVAPTIAPANLSAKTEVSDKEATPDPSPAEEPSPPEQANSITAPNKPADEELAGTRDGANDAADKKTAVAESAKPDASTKPAASKSKPASIKLFGTVEFRGTLKGVPSWTSMLERNKKNPLLVAGAKLNSSTGWDDFKKKLQTMSPMEQLKAVNRFWNQWPYRLDPEVYKKPDYWATPDEFRRNSGDCEDYGIAKYHTLKELGFSPDNMRIVVLMETIRNIAHAVLVVYMDGDAWVLDNLSNSVLSHSRYKNYVPQFSVNEKFRWAHVRPK